ncbi:cytosine permease [Virgibacillus ainsalahensis]
MGERKGETPRANEQDDGTTDQMDEISIEYHATEEVPMSQRNMGFWDMVFLWIGANSNNASWYLGGSVAGAAFGGAIIVALVANPIAYVILAVVGYMGYKIGISTMALTRPAFGIKGSMLPTVLNMIVFIGWAVVNTFIAVISMSFIFGDLFGWAAFGEPGSTGPMILGIIIMSLLNLIAVSLGRKSIKVVERIGVVIILFLGIWMTVIVFQTHPITDIMSWKPSAENKMPIGTAIDIMAAFSLAWVLGIAEFTRYTRTPKAATVAPLLGATTALIWFVFVGVVATIGVTLTTGEFNPDNSDPSSLVSSLGLGWVALLMIIVACVTTNVVNLMAAGVSVTNVTKKIKPLHAIWVVTILAGFLMLIPLYMSSFLDAFMGFLDYIGMALSALLGILIADYFFVQKRKYEVAQLEREGGKYWYFKGVNIKAITIWIVGVIFYLVINPLPLFTNTVGAVYPTIILTASLYFIVSMARRN